MKSDDGREVEVPFRTRLRGLELAESCIEQVLQLFKGFVAKNRPKVDIESIATGETWLGPDALARQMVDELATVDDVLLKHVKDGAEVLGVKFEV